MSFVYHPSNNANVTYEFESGYESRIEPTTSSPAEYNVTISEWYEKRNNTTIAYGENDFNCTITPDYNPEQRYALVGWVKEFGSNQSDIKIDLYRVFPSGSRYGVNNIKSYGTSTWSDGGTVYSYNSGTDYTEFPTTLNTSIGDQTIDKYYVKVQTNVPIFDTEAHAIAYILNDSLDGILNMGEDMEIDTQLFYIYDKRSTASITYGNVNITSEGTWRSMKFYANTIPCFYMRDDTSFAMVLHASKVVSSIGTAGPSYTIDYIPESQWREGELYYTDGFYGDIDKYKTAFAKIPTNGTYTYGQVCDTNIPVFRNQAEAEEFINGDIGVEEALNYDKIASFYDKELTNKTGQPEVATEFGQVYTRAFFSQMYLCTANAVQEVSNALFDYDVPTRSGMWEDIKKGLEMYGTNPMEVIQSLRFYPFDLTSVFTDIGPQNYLWIGAYHLQMTNVVQKIVHLNGYKDLGHIMLKRTFNDWRDFEPYTEVSVYLPYIGRYKIDASKYYNKDVNIRYYIDIRTGACCACLIANGILLDWFDGIIGCDMPITLTDYSSYAQTQLNIIMRNAGMGTIGTAKTGNVAYNMTKNSISSAADSSGKAFADTYVAQGGGDAAMAAASGASKAAGAAGAAGVAGTAALGAIGVGAMVAGVAMKTAFELRNNGVSGYTSARPSASAMINQYLPQYPTFMFEIQEIDESEYLNELRGRPTNKSGTLGSFSGYLECEDIMLICPIATDNERQEIIDLVHSGIYI